MDVDIKDILPLIPQKPPFVMIDQLVYCDEVCSRSKFTIREDNLLVEDGIFAESGLVENIAQTAAAHAGYFDRLLNNPVMIGYIGAVKNLEVFALPKKSDILETEINVDNKIFDVTLISAKVTCNNELLAQCQMKVFIIQKPETL